jgi:hypothetical protein
MQRQTNARLRIGKSGCNKIAGARPFAFFCEGWDTTAFDLRTLEPNWDEFDPDGLSRPVHVFQRDSPVSDAVDLAALEAQENQRSS